MKKFFGIVFILLLLDSAPVFADDDLWEHFGDQNFYGTSQTVSDEEFEKALESKKGEKKPKQMKGKSIQESNETNSINQLPLELPILCIPTPIQINDDSILPVGHYQIIGENRGGKIYFKLYQSHYLMAEFEAVETLEDYNEPELQFVKLVPDGEDNLKIIYGSLDFNAYAVIHPANIE